MLWMLGAMFLCLVEWWVVAMAGSVEEVVWGKRNGDGSGSGSGSEALLLLGDRGGGGVRRLFLDVKKYRCIFERV